MDLRDTSWVPSPPTIFMDLSASLVDTADKSAFTCT